MELKRSFLRSRNHRRTSGGSTSRVATALNELRLTDKLFIKEVFRVEFNSVLLQEAHVFVFEIVFFMVLLLFPNVFCHEFELGRTYRESAIAGSPFKVGF